MERDRGLCNSADCPPNGAEKSRNAGSSDSAWTDAPPRQMADDARFGFTAVGFQDSHRMDANLPPPSRTRTEQAAEDKPRRQYDKLLEFSFYVGALALVALMEWYAHLMDAPRMPWAYFALVMIAAAYAMHRLRPFKAWRTKRRLARRQKHLNRANDGNEPGAVRVTRRTS